MNIHAKYRSTCLYPYIAQEYASLQDTGLNKHLHRINRSDTSNCPNCTDTEETIAHYIGQCPAYSCMRGDTLGTYYDSINNIMDNNNIDLIINFALKTKRLLKKEEKDDTGVTESLLPSSPTSMTV